jgi:3-deoxy-7-phosphoheptulonate synthase
MREEVMSVDISYSSRNTHQSDTIVQVGGIDIGGRAITIIAGPCTVESRNNLMATAKAVKQAGAHLLRGGAFKTRTSPEGFQGLGEAGLILLHEAKQEFGLPVVTEVVDAGDIPLIAKYADMLQVGSRNMQNTALLKALGKANLPVLLKRGFGCTVAEWLAAADYILAGGNEQVVLCERGIRSFEDSTRFSLDILSIPVIKELSHLPLIVDPSHAAGESRYVTSAALAAVAAGADGLLVEVNVSPENAMVDGRQTLDIPGFTSLIGAVEPVARAVGRTI